MQEWDIVEELKSRYLADLTGAWERVKAYYKEIGQSSKLDAFDGLYPLIDLNPDTKLYGITLQDFTYTTLPPVKTPLLVRSDCFENDLSEPAEDEFEFSKAVENTFSFGFTEGLKVGTQTKFKTGIPIIAEGTIEVSLEVTFEANQQVTTTKTNTWGQRITFPVPAHQTVQVSGYITDASINATFTGVAKVTEGMGSVHLTSSKTHQGGSTVLPLSVLLTDEQRSFPVSGTFNGVEGVSAYTHIEPVEGGCENIRGKALQQVEV